MDHHPRKLASSLAARLNQHGLEARTTGAEEQWQVEVGDPGGNHLIIHCHWHSPPSSEPMPRRRPSNDRTWLDLPSWGPRHGAEYRTKVRRGSEAVLDGRTSILDEAVAAAVEWITHGSLETLEKVAPFIGAGPRARRALTGQLDPRLRHEAEWSNTLWVYGDGRSCEVAMGEFGTACRFFLGQASVARSMNSANLAAIISAWLVDPCALGTLAERDPTVELEPHAHLLPEQPARWHWAYLLERVTFEDDPMVRLRPLVEALANSPIASTFYSYSSMFALCFSASSHFPWVDEELPKISRGEKDQYLIWRHWGPRDESEPLIIDNLTDAVQEVEQRLAASPLRPFFGCDAHHSFPALAGALERLKSPLRPQLLQRRALYDLVVASGSRSCKVYGGDTLVLSEGEDSLKGQWPTVEDAARAIDRFCSGGASLDELAADPLVADAERSQRRRG